MGNLGTFKPYCLRGHDRKIHADKTGHCRACRSTQDKERLATFKPRCVRGHDRNNNVDSRGHCQTCKKERWRKTQTEYSWQYAGIIKDDGSPFNMNDYNRAFQIQGGQCGCCQRHQSLFKRTLVVDHCHKTGLFRGLLCFHCNLVLGMMQDDSEMLENFKAYLEKNR